MNEEQLNKIEKLKEQVNKGYIGINRVPKKELDWFLQWTENEFEGDRGMALKELVLKYNEFCDTKEAVLNFLNGFKTPLVITNQVQTNNQENEEEITLGDGRKIRRKLKNE